MNIRGKNPFGVHLSAIVVVGVFGVGVIRLFVFVFVFVLVLVLVLVLVVGVMNVVLLDSWFQ
jgi:hypothetical protein